MSRSKIQIGDRNLTWERDYDINTRSVVIAFLDHNASHRKAVLFRLRHDEDNQDNFTMRERESMSDDFYMKQAIAKMESLGGFGAIATSKLPGEYCMDATLVSEYFAGAKEMSDRIMQVMWKLPVKEAGELQEACTRELSWLMERRGNA